MKAFWHKTAHSKLLPAFFISTLVGLAGAFVYSDTFATDTTTPSWRAYHIAWQEAGGSTSNPAYFEKKCNVNIAEVQQYGSVAYGTCNKTKYADDEWNVSQAWCANFVSWVYAKAGFPFTGGPKSGGWRYPSTVGLRGYLQKNATRITSPSKVLYGDIFYRSGHVGIIRSYDKSRNLYLTIEGNSYGGGDSRHRVVQGTESTSVEVYRPTFNYSTPKPPGGIGGIKIRF